MCLMNDHSVSERHYSKYGGLTGQRMYPAKANIEEALQFLGELTTKYKSDHY